MGSIKAKVNYHTSGPLEEGKEYVDYKVIRGTVINEYKLERTEISVLEVSNYKPDLFKLGFTWTNDPNRTFSSEEVQDKEVIKEYEEGLIRIIRQENPNVAEIKPFDHTIRQDTADDMKRAEDLNKVPEDARFRPVAMHVHGDYTRDSAWEKLKAVLSPEEYEDWSKGHWGIVNIWRPMDYPVEKTPLAFIDPTTVTEDDCAIKEIRIPGRVGHIKGFLNRPHYRWVMLDQMPPSKVWIFNQFDTGSIPWVPHSALDIVGTPEDAKPRRSIESRLCVRYYE
jgi:hypothetical protein